MEHSATQLGDSGGQNLRPMRITVAPNGARRNKQSHPQLPVTLNEIVSCAKACWQAGAHEIHLHVRDADGRHSLSSEIYETTIAALRVAVPDMAIQVTTESANQYDVAAQFDLLKTLKPDAASIAIRETMRRPEYAAPLYAFADHSKIKVQHILYSRQDLELLREQLKIGTIPQHMRDVLLVFGTYTPPRLAEPSEVTGFVAALGTEFPNWTVCAFGQHENAVAAEAIRLGGHIRIGFENNLHRPDGAMAQDNSENIARAVQTAASFHRPLMTRP